MDFKVFCIFDNAVEAFNKPFYFLTKAEAIRAFQDLVNDTTTQISKHPQDFSLYYLGKWNNSTSEHEKGICEDMGTALQYRNEKENSPDQIELIPEVHENMRVAK